MVLTAKTVIDTLYRKLEVHFFLMINPLILTTAKSSLAVFGKIFKTKA